MEIINILKLNYQRKNTDKMILQKEL